MPPVPVIIPYFRAPEKLSKCVAALEAQVGATCDVFVRDNSDDNILFTAAVNEGMRKYCFRPDVDFVLVLNQDAYLDPDCLRRLLDFMQGNPECGIACPLQVGAGEGGARTVTWGGSRQAFPLGVHECDELRNYTSPRETFWANGACMLIRTELVKEIGVFDRNMRFICSDADYSFTARSRGWKVFIVPGALVEHGLAASATATNRDLSIVKARDILYFGRKWLTGDLYKGLSFEGKELTRIGVRMQVEKFQKYLDVLEGRAGSVRDYFKLRQS
ncbi:glycosyltransferase family 2 protein [Caenimonas terrae]|uniref:Glycosyltransferase family 2 protein n=1 Tax=Caenimonas terrae TaxID=696074 RepID=A0ABW0NC21_9BURK